MRGVRRDGMAQPSESQTWIRLSGVIFCYLSWDFKLNQPRMFLLMATGCPAPFLLLLGKGPP